VSQPKTYEYAHLIVGVFFNPGETADIFMHVRSLTGDTTDADFGHGDLEALNMMGAQGWQVISRQDPTEGRLQHIAVAVAVKKDLRPAPLGDYQASEYLLMREVRD
jgi:hypothetical protein